MTKIVQVNLDRLGEGYRELIERRSRETNQSEEDIIVEMLKREDWLERFRALNRKLSPYAKDMTEEEILSLPRTSP